jgi:hypothetical protein
MKKQIKQIYYEDELSLSPKSSITAIKSLNTETINQVAQSFSRTGNGKDDQLPKWLK